MTSPDIHRPAEPLSPEERAMGERLARLGPHGEPSPALDAGILAAAHAAARGPARAQGPGRRWPLALGLAASLTLAVGIAWQLRPAQEAAVYDEAASATRAPGDTAARPQPSGADVAAVEEAGPVAAQPTPAAETAAAGNTAAGAQSDRSLPAQRPAAQRARAPAPAPPASPEPEVVFDDVAPTDAAIQAPAAPPAAPVAAPARAPAAAAKAGSGQTRNQASERSSTEATAGTVKDQAAQSREDAFAEDVPPATADSPAVREAWLQRIRELHAAGNTVDARASLDEFVHRYPNHPLPDDLRALLE